MLTLTLFITISALTSATFLPTRTEPKIADNDFLNKQIQVLDLYGGLGQIRPYKNKFSNWDLKSHLQSFADEKYPREFFALYHHGLLQEDAIFTLACPHAMREAVVLFDLFYFANDFDTFIKVASWSRDLVNYGMFFFSYTLALYHRHDCQSFYTPPFYEIFPNFFVPIDTLRKFQNAKMLGQTTAHFSYNSSGYENSYHSSMFGGVLGSDNRGHSEFKISYFTEDVGLNAWYSEMFFRSTLWMDPQKYNLPPDLRPGEHFYFILQNMLARYTNERLANLLPFTESLNWRKPIKVGYNPRVSYVPGQPFYIRPDNINPFETNERGVEKAEESERRLGEIIDAGVLWDTDNKIMIKLDEDNGTEILARIVYGGVSRPSAHYYQSVYSAGVKTLSYLISTASDRTFVGGAVSTSVTSLRDPVYYRFLTKLLHLFQRHKSRLGPYTRDQIIYNGVTVKNIEVDKLYTFTERFVFEVTNALPVNHMDEYINNKYFAQEYRLNHKPFQFNIKVHSEKAGDAMIRIFLGPKYDAENRLLSINQARLAFVEIDRFPVSLSAGLNIWQRNSSESPITVEERTSFRSLYTSILQALDQKEKFYIHEGGRCGFPGHLILPKGWNGGRPAMLAIVVTPYDRMKSTKLRAPNLPCGGSRLNDHKPIGFPFDREADFSQIPNIFFKDVLIYHKE